MSEDRLTYLAIVSIKSDKTCSDVEYQDCNHEFITK